MVARITDYTSRADAGLPRARAFSRHIRPRGCAFHYNGPAVPWPDDHAGCVDIWRRVRDYHVDVRGFHDIAYTGGVCHHGVALAGRGAGIRTAANGTSTGNYRYYAIYAMLGSTQLPTREMLDGAEWWIHTLRQDGAGDRVVPHNQITSTACPGLFLTGWTQTVDRNRIDVAQPKRTQEEDVFFIVSPEGSIKDWWSNGLGRRWIDGPSAYEWYQDLMRRHGYSVEQRSKIIVEDDAELERVAGPDLDALARAQSTKSRRA